MSSKDGRTRRPADPGGTGHDVLHTHLMSADRMRIGAVFSQADTGTDPDAMRRWVVDVESAGFEHVLAYDHILGASPERLGPGPFGAFPAAPYTSEHTFHEILVLFSHFAALTSRLSS